MARFAAFLLPALWIAAAASPAAAAESVMVQCGQQYQSAKAAGTLNGMDWNQYRVECSNRLKAQPAATSAPSPAAQVPAVQPAPVAGAATPQADPAAAKATRPQSAGMAAMHARQKQCGAEWTSQKATLVAQTPGLTWPRYWSQCNTRLKAAGR